VTDHGLPEDAIVSIRFGTTRRQAPLESVSTNPLKFPSSLESVCEPLKIDVLKPIATTRLVVHPHEDQYTIGFDPPAQSALQTLSPDDGDEIQEDMYIGLNIKPTTSGSNERPDGSVRPGSAMPVKFQDAAASAKDYLEQHGLLRYVQSMLHAVIQVKPKDPYAFMMEQLGASKSKAASVRSRPSIRPSSRPSSAIGGRTVSRPTSARALPSGRQPFPPEGPPPGPGESSPLRQSPHVVPPSGPPITPEPSPPEAPPEPKPPEEPPIKEEDVRAPLATPPMLPDGPAVEGGSEAKQSPTQPQAEPLPAGTPATESAKDEKSELEELRLRMRAVFETAHSTGQLEKAVEQALLSCEAPVETKPPAEEVKLPPPEDEALKLKSEMRAILEQSIQNGVLEEAIRKTQAGREQVQAKEESQTEDNISETKSKIRELLNTSTENGDLAAALEKLASQKSTDELQKIKSELRDTLTAALDGGRLEAALPREAKASAPEAPVDGGEAAEVKASPQKLPTTPVKSKMQDLLAEASASGKLEAALDAAKMHSRPSSPVAKRPPSSKTADAPTDKELQEIKFKLRNTMDEAAKTGTLAEALQKIPRQANTVVPKPPPGQPPAASDIEEVKAKLRAHMQEATENGQLAAALAKMSQADGPGAKSAEDVDLENTKAKLRGLLVQGVESGRLSEALNTLNTKASSPGSRPTDQVAETKQKLRALLAEGSQSGKLEEALRVMAAKKQTSETNGLEDTKEKLKVLMRQATESGQLEEALRTMSEKKAQDASSTTAAVSDTDQVRAKLRSVMQEATESGKLEEALQNTFGKRPAPEPATDELAETKAKLRSVMQEATESGMLEDILRNISSPKAKKASPEQDIEQTKAKLRNLMQEATETGKLEAALRKINGKKVEAAGAEPMASPDMEEAKAKLRNLLQAAHETGTLEAAFQKRAEGTTEVASDPAPPVADAKLQGAIEKLTQEKEDLRRVNEDLEKRLAAMSKGP